MGIFQLGLAVCILTLCWAKTAEEWKTRVIYQLLTDRFGHTGNNPNTTCQGLRSYCGGTFKGIQQRLDYIQGIGANAIWISPTVENTHLGYHGYWAKNIYKVNPEFGTEEDLKSLITECHKRDIWVMFDVVANHMGRNHGCKDRSCQEAKLLNYTGFVPFDQPEHYHKFCFIEDYGNQTQTELCRLGTLPDLNQTVPYVKETLLDWISNLTRDYDVDGLRIDTVCEIEKPFWLEFQKAAGVFCLGEANNGDRPEYLAAYQGAALEALLNFPMYWAFRRAFNEQKPMTGLVDSISLQREIFNDTTVLGLFVDNHDFQRFLNMTPDGALLRNALAYVFFGQGIPLVYYGTEQMFNGGNDPNNRESLWPHTNDQSEMYKFIKRLADGRKASDVDFGQLNQKEVYVDNNTLVITRGETQTVIAAVTNTGKSKESIKVSVANLTDNPVGMIFENVLDNSDTASVKGGVMDITLTSGEPKVFKLTQIATTVAPAPSLSAKCSLSLLLLPAVLIIHLARVIKI